MASTCSKCNFPAVASAEEIALGAVKPTVAHLSLRDRIVRGAIVFGYSLLVLGAWILTSFFLTSTNGVIVGAGIIAVGGLLVFVCARMKRA
jgi:hypothetical protein